MAQQQRLERLGVLQRRWKAESFVFCGLLAMTVSLLSMSLLHTLLGWGWWIGALLFLLCFAAALFLFPYWRISLTDITRYLDRQLPELEESCGLLLRPAEELGPLERLQVARIEGKLGVSRMPKPLQQKLLLAGGLLLLAMALSAAVLFLATMRRVGGSSRNERTGVAGAAPAVKMAPGVRMVTIGISPPAYTGRAKRSQALFSLQVEEGALLSWELVTTGTVDTVSFLFNDTTRLLLHPVDASRTIWRLSAPALHSGFYQVHIGDQVSELYKLEIIKDEPPRIIIRTPQSHTLVDYGESTRVPLVVRLQDDYGISDAAIMATVSSGKGEAVKFKEQELRWGKPFTGAQSADDLSKTLDLSALGMKPGDELYFYCRAKDNHGQEARTDMYIITLADTAQLMSLEGMTLASDVKPEFFRSERQIIIETEALLKAKDTLGVADFNSKSNDLGIDQKLLRLRYGKFLGEEAEEGGAPGAEGKTGGGAGEKAVGGAGEKPGAFGDAAKILDAYTDKHDNAEDATFFEPGVKAQLKATLSEMWSAELRLRTYKPAEALPYAYKALRLLKDLQQQSRSYVAKTGVKVTPLNPARRLTGELGTIQAPAQRAQRETGLTEEEQLRIVLGLLEGGRISGDGSRVLLAQVERRLGVAAATRPGEFLEGYQAMKKIIEGKGGDVEIVQRAIRRLLPVAQAAPVKKRGMLDAGLSQLYFSHIGKP